MPLLGHIAQEHGAAARQTRAVHEQYHRAERERAAHRQDNRHAVGRVPVVAMSAMQPNSSASSTHNPAPAATMSDFGNFPLTPRQIERRRAPRRPRYAAVNAGAAFGNDQRARTCVYPRRAARMPPRHPPERRSRPPARDCRAHSRQHSPRNASRAHAPYRATVRLCFVASIARSTLPRTRTTSASLRSEMRAIRSSTSAIRFLISAEAHP